MSDNESRKEEAVIQDPKILLEEKIINEILKNLDLSKLLEQDYLMATVNLVPGKLAAEYMSPYDGELFEAEEDADTLKIEDPALRELYRYRRALAVSLVAINGTQFMPGAGVGTKVEGLKRKPRHLVDKLTWGYVLFQEALNRLLKHPEELEKHLKNS